MKAYLIDPRKRKISKVDYNGDFHQICGLINADIFTVVYPFNNRDSIYVDDMGLYEELNYCFSVKCDNGTTQDLYGNGLVLGTNEEGESVAVKTSLAELKKRISFKGAMHIVTSNNGFEIYPMEVQ
tara:strand:- start:154 stop:531 length:378 start_codon:yes stop_codon:yes gene_type:complete